MRIKYLLVVLPLWACSTNSIIDNEKSEEYEVYTHKIKLPSKPELMEMNTYISQTDNIKISMTGGYVSDLNDINRPALAAMQLTPTSNTFSEKFDKEYIEKHAIFKQFENRYLAEFQYTKNNKSFFNRVIVQEDLYFIITADMDTTYCKNQCSQIFKNIADSLQISSDKFPNEKPPPAAKRKTSGMWKVTNKNNEESYLFGTLHVGSKFIYNKPVVIEALKNSKQVLTELNMNEIFFNNSAVQKLKRKHTVRYI